VLWNDEKVTLNGTVVREEALSPQESTLWRSRVAIAIDPNDPVLAKIVGALG
jgi:hypothetical protein